MGKIIPSSSLRVQWPYLSTLIIIDLYSFSSYSGMLSSTLELRNQFLSISVTREGVALVEMALVTPP